jgi:hypothetical protein
MAAFSAEKAAKTAPKRPKIAFPGEKRPWNPFFAPKNAVFRRKTAFFLRQTAEKNAKKCEHRPLRKEKIDEKKKKEKSDERRIGISNFQLCAVKKKKL